MISFQKVTICGRMGKDPETKSFPNGGSITNFSVATSETWKDKQSGEKKERTEWHSISVQNEQKGKFIAQYGKKGDMVLIEGQLKTRKWQDKDGNDRYTTEIVVPMFGGDVQLHSDKKSGGSGSFDEDDGDTKTTTKAKTSTKTVHEDLNDEIPF